MNREELVDKILDWIMADWLQETAGVFSVVLSPAILSCWRWEDIECHGTRPEYVRNCLEKYISRMPMEDLIGIAKCLGIPIEVEEVEYEYHPPEGVYEYEKGATEEVEKIIEEITTPTPETTQSLIDQITSGFQEIANVFSGNLGSVIGTIESGFESLKTEFERVISDIGSWISSIEVELQNLPREIDLQLTSLTTSLGAFSADIIEGISKVIDNLQIGFSGLSDILKIDISGITKEIQKKVDEVTKSFEQILDGLEVNITKAWEDLQTQIREPLENLTKSLEEFFNPINETLTSIWITLENMFTTDRDFIITMFEAYMDAYQEFVKRRLQQTR